mgnify:CR=1 FL=1
MGTKGKSKIKNFQYQKEMKNYYSTANKSIYGQTDHPTEKPVELFEKLVKVNSHEGDIVLDPFMGSGTTAVAALKQNRKFIGFEKDIDYYNISLKRIGKFDKKYYDELPEEEKPEQNRLV